MGLFNYAYNSVLITLGAESLFEKKIFPFFLFLLPLTFTLLLIFNYEGERSGIIYLSCLSGIVPSYPTSFDVFFTCPDVGVYSVLNLSATIENPIYSKIYLKIKMDSRKSPIPFSFKSGEMHFSFDSRIPDSTI